MWAGTEALHQGNARADAATLRGIHEHPYHSRLFTQILQGRGQAYLTFVERQATLMKAIADEEHVRGQSGTCHGVWPDKDEARDEGHPDD